ncbi:MAG: ribonuclease III [Leptolyngbyaceae cyanobacterium SM1_1_3]|nr:ribonuclease III [Leptolyngbyaceae cyanobacterium SM1_1_3]NJN01093.1 ribonuclease III [Leptolyngbyaceae cyanobacterium RM1_1_2]NJO10759.1 ribonuclease III [Leptolyngbyaceae cyanobacterium SL_1_1]
MSLKLPPFKSSALLQQALTHKSYTSEFPKIANNERIEFLGDAILTFLCGDFLYKRYPGMSEGELTPLRAALVDAKQLGEFARMLDLGTKLHMSRGVEGSGGRTNMRLLSSAFEAVVGAYFLDSDSDVEAVRAYIAPLFSLVVDQLAIAVQTTNYKSRLQEWALAKFGEIPRYVIAGQSGPDHDRQFVAEVFIQDTLHGQGQGRRKQDAEKEAAKAALDKVECRIQQSTPARTQ